MTNTQTSSDPFEGARSFTLLARGKTSAPQSAAYGRKPMAICCRKRQLFCRRLLRSGYAAAPLRVTQKSRAAFFIISCASENHAFSSELSTALSHCSFGAMLACALRSSSSQKSHFVAIFGSPFSATQFGKTLPVAGKVNARDFYNGVPYNIARRGKPPLSRA